MSHKDGGQVDKIVTFGREGRGFEFSHRPSTSLLGIPLLTVTPFLNKEIYIVVSSVKRN